MTQQRKPGDRIPDVTFHTRSNDAWQDVSTRDLFAGKRVVLFALPGAFTPTCSSTHLPGFAAGADRLAEAGIDAICCLSVNDSFVMNAWAKTQPGAERVIMVPDGNGDFTRAMGMMVDKNDLGFGERSWRYAMIVDDGVIEAMFVEDRNETGDPFRVSDVGTVLDYLSEAPQAEAKAG